MGFTRSIEIQTNRDAVFAFLRDKHTYRQEAGSPVLRLDKTTQGPVDVGTRYVEVVRMLGPIRGTITSTITRFEPPERLHERFQGAGMVGHLAYEIQRQDSRTLLVQNESIRLRGVLRPFTPLMLMMLLPRIEQRLRDIRDILEARAQESES